MTGTDHLMNPPSPWVQRFAKRIRQGGGSSTSPAAGAMPAGWRARMEDRGGRPRFGSTGQPCRGSRGEVRVADLELSAYFAGRHFAGIVVTNYLHRPLLPADRGRWMRAVLI